jgi:uncharacterized protein (DUF305 family)
MRLHRTDIVSARVLPAVVATALAVAVSACGAPDDADTGADNASGTAVEAGEEANAADVMFVQMMIPHHEQAVVMADDALAISDDSDIRALAQDIRGAQQPEIDRMRGWLDDWGVPEMMDGDRAGHMGHGGMSGMMSEQDLEDLRTLSGPEFDRTWTEMMIEHHEGAVEMAEEVRDAGRSTGVRELADDIITAQQAEIDLMTSWSANGGR